MRCQTHKSFVNQQQRGRSTEKNKFEARGKNKKAKET